MLTHPDLLFELAKLRLAEVTRQAEVVRLAREGQQQATPARPVPDQEQRRPSELRRSGAGPPGYRPRWWRAAGGRRLDPRRTMESTAKPATHQSPRVP